MHTRIPNINITTAVPAEDIENLIDSGFRAPVTRAWLRLVAGHSEPVTGAGVVVVEADGRECVLDRAAVQRGCQLMADRFPRHWGDFHSRQYDATTGSVFLQCALLGDVLFG